MKYKYITIMNFNGIDRRVGLEESNFKLEENMIIKGYKIYIKINDKQFDEIYKLLYGRDD